MINSLNIEKNTSVIGIDQVSWNVPLHEVNTEKGSWCKPPYSSPHLPVYKLIAIWRASYKSLNQACTAVIRPPLTDVEGTFPNISNTDMGEMKLQTQTSYSLIASLPHWAPIARRQMLVSEVLLWSLEKAYTVDKMTASITVSSSHWSSWELLSPHSTPHFVSHLQLENAWWSVVFNLRCFALQGEWNTSLQLIYPFVLNGWFGWWLPTFSVKCDLKLIQSSILCSGLQYKIQFNLQCCFCVGNAGWQFFLIVIRRVRKDTEVWYPNAVESCFWDNGSKNFWII